MSGLKVKIYFLVPYPIHEAPSQRFRFEQYLPILKNAGFEYTISSFLDRKAWSILYKPGNIFWKALKIIRGFLRRLADLFNMRSYDYIFIHREAAPIGPPVIEWIIAKILKKKIIYDFDDAIWIPNISENNKIAAGLKWHSKVGSICTWSYKVSCGNSYLADYAKKYNQMAIVNPTTIDTEHVHNQIKDQHTDEIIIGWTGTHSTSQYLDIVIPTLKKLAESMKFTFIVISNNPLKYDLEFIKFKQWNKDSEITDLLEFNIGLMPLSDDPWAKGKCGFKALQYMSLGIPALVSPIGVNIEIVDDLVNGMICETASQWESSIKTLLNNEMIRIQMGLAARKKVQKYYSVQSNSVNFLALFS